MTAELYLLARAHQSTVSIQHAVDHLIQYIQHNVAVSFSRSRLWPQFLFRFETIWSLFKKGTYQ